MLWEELLWRERKEGREEALKDALYKIMADKNIVSDTIEKMVLNQDNTNILQEWILIAAKVTSAKQFLEQIEQ